MNKELLQQAHRLGFLRCAGWAQRDDLFADVDSPTYKKDCTQDLARLEAAIAQPTRESRWSTPTTYLQRLGDAMQALCGGHRPPDEMMTAWLHHDADDLRLQEFACEYGPTWAQGIGIVDAALVLADQPTKGPDHEYREAAIAQPAAVALKDAAQAVLDRWNSSKWEWHKQGPTADLMHALEAAIAQPTQEEYAQGYAEGFNDACKPVQQVEKQGELIGYVAKDGFTILYFQSERLPFETELYIKQGGAL